MELNQLLWAQVWVFLVSGFAYFLLSFRRSSSRRTSKNSAREWNFCLKKLWSKYHIEKWKKSDKSYKIEFEERTEEPATINDNDTFDSQFFWGSNSEGCSIFIKLSRNFGGVSEVAIILKTADGTVYRMPNQPDTVVFDASSNSWSAGNLKIILLEPFKRWRIIFNGLLRKGNISECIEDTEQPLHVKMNFIWISGSIPTRVIDDCDTNLLAEAVARESWTDPNWLNGIKNYPIYGYEQYGSLSGLVVISDLENPLEIFLSGIRERRWGLRHSRFMERSLNLVGKISDGTYYNISVQSLKKHMKHLVLGNVRVPNGDTFPIEWTDIDASEIGEYKSYIRKAFTIKFKAGQKYFTAVIHLDNNKRNLLREGRPWEWENLIIPFQGSVNDFQGVGILQLGYNYTGDCPLQLVNENKLFLLNESKNVELDDICLSLQDEKTRNSQFVGAKASSLALLMSVESKEYQVPSGFCLTIRALNLQLEKNISLLHAIKEIEENNSNKEMLQLSCDKAYKCFAETGICQSVKESVSTYFEELINFEKSKKNASSDLYFAVRSSGIGEDSEDLSAAGQNATILGCKSIDDIYKAIQKCWASLFTYQSVEYRRQHGQQVNCGMGVVVQTIVEAEAAGVMFTRHPMTGDPSCILITSNYGLGESVVSGKIEPDSIYIERDLENKIRIRKIDIGSKSHKMTLDKLNNDMNSRLQTTEINEESNKPSLNEENCLKLGNIAISQETMWRSPRDIEWAISNGIVYLVQARPITTLKTWTEFELLHELDSPYMSDNDLMTFANAGEVLPGCFSPLSQTTILPVLDNAVMSLTGRAQHNYFQKTLTSTHYHIGLNVLNTMLTRVSKEISFNNKVTDLAVFGHIVTDEKMHSIAKHRNGMINAFGVMSDIFKYSMVLFKSSTIAKSATEYSKYLEIDINKYTNSMDIYKKIKDNMLLLATPCTSHNHTSSASSFTQFVFFTILMEGKDEITMENYMDIGTVLSSCSDVISADVPSSLNELAKSIQESGDINTFSKLESKNGVQWLKDNCPDSYHKFNDFLKKHGHRSIKEFDMATDPWELNPESVILALQSALKFPKQNEKVIHEGNIVDRLASPIKFLTKMFLKFIIPICQKSVANREETKSALIYSIHKFRLAYKKLAEQMVKEWKIPDEKLIFYMTERELGRFLKYGEPEYINKASLRRRFFSKWENMKFPEICWGFPKPIENIPSTEFNSDCDIVRGTPVYTGNIVGRACVVHHLSEISQLENGDILITHSTDIGWSPYFPVLGGVVTELGGLISHGAVVAREYGLPCIVGAINATSVFKTGDTVLLNATKGTIQKTNAP